MIGNEPGEVYNEAAMILNMQMISRCRTALALLAGATAGILGLTGLSGFIFYILSSVLMSFILTATAGVHWDRYVISKSMLWTDGIASGLFVSNNVSKSYQVFIAC
jgi:hypothetical protein